MQNNLITRAEAQTQGLLRYFTGKPCGRGHVAPRLVSSFCCVECKKKHRKQWAQRYPEKHVKHVVAWAKRNSTKKAEINRRYWANNPDAQLHMRLARKFNITLEQYFAMLKVQRNRCAICRVHVNKLTRGLAVDHCHDTGKIRALLCHTCNQHLGIYERHRGKFEAYLAQYGAP